MLPRTVGLYPAPCSCNGDPSTRGNMKPLELRRGRGAGRTYLQPGGWGGSSTSPKPRDQAHLQKVVTRPNLLAFPPFPPGTTTGHPHSHTPLSQVTGIEKPKRGGLRHRWRRGGESYCPDCSKHRAPAYNFLRGFCLSTDQSSPSLSSLPSWTTAKVPSLLATHLPFCGNMKLPHSQLPALFISQSHA